MLNGPPPATVARRAKSYSDFYDVVRAHLKREKLEGDKSDKDVNRRKSREHMANDSDFADW